MFRKTRPADPRLAALELTANEVQALARHGSVVDADAGTELCAQGRTHGQVTWLVSGTADVIRGGARIATLGPGDVAGEITMVTDLVAYTADVVTTSPAVVVVLSRREWQAAVADAPRLAERLGAVAADRLKALVPA